MSIQPIPTARRKPPKVDIGTRMRLIRRELNQTQSQFAAGLSEFMPISEKSFGAYEAGYTKPPRVDELSTALEAYTGVPRVWFLGWGDDPTPDRYTPRGLNPEPTEYGTVRPVASLHPRTRTDRSTGPRKRAA